MTHTPGPWKHNELPAEPHRGLEDYLPCAVWTPDGKKFIATTIGSPSKQAACERLEAAANCRLIAAAPELLEALTRLLAEFDAYDAAMTNLGRGHEDYGGQREAARAAIAKATQSTP